MQVTCEALSATQARFAFTAFDRAFQEFRLPAAIRTDNGVPFAAPTALYWLAALDDFRNWLIREVA